MKLGNGEVVKAKGGGTVSIETKKGIKSISNVLYTLELGQNLLSVTQMFKNGYSISLKENFCCISNSFGVEITKVKIQGNSFYLKFDSVDECTLKATLVDSDI